MPTDDLVSLADHLLDALCRDHPIGYIPSVVWKNLRVSAGLANYTIGSIILSRQLLTDPERLESTLKHEYAHLMAVARHGKKGAGHGPLWKGAMVELGLEPTVRHCYSVKRNAKHQEVGYRCRRCGALITRARRLNRGRKYYHVPCGGPLKLEYVRMVDADATH